MINLFKPNAIKFIEKNFIDERNKQIWNSLKEKYSFKINYSTNEEYSCYIQGKNVIVYYDKNNLSKDSFTHELLHVHLNFKEFHLGNSLLRNITTDSVLSIILTHPLLEHISNCLDHIKMFPIYNEMGFQKNEFLLDYFYKKCDSADVLKLNIGYRPYNSIDISAADFFIGKLIAMLCDINEELNYTEELNAFRAIDKELYSAVLKLVTDTTEYDINNVSDLNKYNNISVTFQQNLKKWYSNNKFTASVRS